MICTTPDCETPTQTYLCTQCVSDLQASIEYAQRLLPDLDVTIARLDVTRPGNPETRNTNVAGSAAPANMDALQIKLNIESITHTAEEYAKEDHAAGTAWIISEWCKSAEMLISGPEAETPEHPAEIIKKIKGNTEPMTAKDCAAWLSKATGIHFTSKRIRNWVTRRGLQPVTTEGNPKYLPEDVLTAYRKRERDVA